MENNKTANIRAAYSKAKRILTRHKADIIATSLFWGIGLTGLGLALSLHAPPFSKVCLTVGSLGLMGFSGEAFYKGIRPTMDAEFSSASPAP